VHLSSGDERLCGGERKTGFQTTVAAAALASLDEPMLAARIANGDREAFEWVMRRYNRRLYRLARAVLRDDTEAMDALQDAYLRAYRSMGQFRGDAALSTWLSRLVLNECNGRLRRSNRRENIVSIVSSNQDMDAYSKVPEPGQSPDDLAAHAQLRVLLERKVGELPEIFRVVFVLRSIEELGVEEVAESLGLTPETVRSRHFRAKGMLRESLAREIDLAQDGIFEFGGRCCDQVVANVLARLEGGES
jgi:RNA polymerase sigma factor (sigma-70 family)